MNKSLKILCLHGYGTNADIMSKQLKKYSELYPTIDFITLDGPLVNPVNGYPYGLHDNRLDSLTKEPFRSNLSNIRGDIYQTYPFQDDRSPNLDLEKSSQSVELKKDTTYYTDKIKELGGVDGLLGFSQGTAIVYLIFCDIELGISPLSKQNMPKFCIFMGAIRGWNNFVINSPSLHIMGEADFVTEHSIIMSMMFYKPSVFYHQSGHKIPPINSAFKNLLDKFLEIFMNESDEVLEQVLKKKKWSMFVIGKVKDQFGVQYPKL